MKIYIETAVEGDYKEIFSKFNLELFEKLKPPLLGLEVLRFDGCKTGDEVHLKVGLGPIKVPWVSVITFDSVTERECLFIDEGRVLPFPLKTWSHRHRIVHDGHLKAKIIDDIDFSTGNVFLDYVMYPALYVQFALRKPVYRRL